MKELIINESNKKENDFINSIKYIEDPDKNKLLKIQKEIEKNGIDKSNIALLTKNLNQIQKEKLLNLYKEQINSLNNNINNIKEKIIKIKKNVSVF